MFRGYETARFLILPLSSLVEPGALSSSVFFFFRYKRFQKPNLPGQPNSRRRGASFFAISWNMLGVSNTRQRVGFPAGSLEERDC